MTSLHSAIRISFFCAALAAAGAQTASSVAIAADVRPLPGLGFSLPPPAGVSINPSKDAAREVWLDGAELYGTAWLESIPAGADPFERAIGLLVEFWIENIGDAASQSRAPDIQPFQTQSGLAGRQVRMTFMRPGAGALTAMGFIFKSDGDDVLIVEWRTETTANGPVVDAAMKGLIKTNVAATETPKPKPEDLFNEINVASAKDWATQTVAAADGALTVGLASGDATGIVCANPTGRDALLPLTGISVTAVPVGGNIIRFELLSRSNPSGLGSGIGFRASNGDAIVLLIKPDRTQALFSVTPEGRWRFFRTSPESTDAWLPCESINGNGANVVRVVRTETGARFEINGKPARQIALTPLIPVAPVAAVAGGATLQIADVRPAN